MRQGRFPVRASRFGEVQSNRTGFRRELTGREHLEAEWLEAGDCYRMKPEFAGVKVLGVDLVGTLTRKVDMTFAVRGSE